jgi:hypothetical protein
MAWEALSPAYREFRFDQEQHQMDCGKKGTTIFGLAADIDATPTRKIDQLVADARSELKRLGIETQGKRSDELLNMARQQRNKLRVMQLKLQ